MSLVQWAHQGGAREAPANTLDAMRKAITGGAEGVALELDVHRTADDELVVIHDPTLHRTTNGFGRVRRHSYAGVIDHLDAAHWWTEGEVAAHDPDAGHELRGKGVRVPTLREVLELRRDLAPEARVTIEIKARGAALPTMALLHAEDWGAAPITVTSFRGGTVRRARREHRQLGGGDAIEFSPGLGYLVGVWLLTLVGLRLPFTTYARLQIPTRRVLSFATPRLIRAAHRTPVIGRGSTAGQRLAVDVWTVDDADAMRALIGLDVDGIMTDRPSVLREVVGGPARAAKRPGRRAPRKR